MLRRWLNVGGLSDPLPFVPHQDILSPVITSTNWMSMSTLKIWTWDSRRSWHSGSPVDTTSQKLTAFFPSSRKASSLGEDQEDETMCFSGITPLGTLWTHVLWTTSDKTMTNSWSCTFLFRDFWSIGQASLTTLMWLWEMLFPSMKFKKCGSSTDPTE